jgi:hypothetical protein
VPDALNCVSGSSYECTYTAKGKWTGELCCK